MTTATYGTTIVRAMNPDVEWIDITPLGATRPLLIEKWRGWVCELWLDWDRTAWEAA